MDIAENSVIVELTAKTPRVEAFLSLLKPFGILESARTGKEIYLHESGGGGKKAHDFFSFRFDGDA